MASENVVTITDANFAAEVLASSVPVLVDFWAEWCMPCRMLAPTVDELAGEYDGRIKFGKLNVDQNREAAKQYGITGIPALLIFKNGQLARKIVGVKPKKDIKAELDGQL